MICALRHVQRHVFMDSYFLGTSEVGPYVDEALSVLAYGTELFSSRSDLLLRLIDIFGLTII